MPIQLRQSHTAQFSSHSLQLFSSPITIHHNSVPSLTGTMPFPAPASFPLAYSSHSEHEPPPAAFSRFTRCPAMVQIHSHDMDGKRVSMKSFRTQRSAVCCAFLTLALVLPLCVVAHAPAAQAAGTAIAAQQSTPATVKLPAYYSNGMVFQRGKPITVTGELKTSHMRISTGASSAHPSPWTTSGIPGR